MADDVLIRQITGIVTDGAPLVLAAVGETLNERAGTINLGLDGGLTLAAFGGFLTALTVQGSLSANPTIDSGVVTAIAALAGVIVAILIGVGESLLVAFSGIGLKRSQVAVGFVLTLLCRDLAIFLGEKYRDRGGVSVLYMPIPVLKDIPILGPILFQHDPFTYLSLIAPIIAWFWIFRTRPGLMLRTVGERPETAFARGANVNRVRYVYAIVGGALIGVGGAAYTLNVNLNWNESAITGNGWIALAMVIFGGWRPVRVAFGIYLVAALRAVVTSLQSSVSSEVIELINALPWLLTVATLFLVSGPYLERLLKILPPRLHPPIRALLRTRAPAALGVNFEQS